MIRRRNNIVYYQIPGEHTTNKYDNIFTQRECYSPEISSHNNIHFAHCNEVDMNQEVDIKQEVDIEQEVYVKQEFDIQEVDV